MDLELAEKTAIIAGASRGIGRATAIALAGEGANVVLCARNEDELRTVAGELPDGRAHTVAADLTDPAACRQLVDAAIDRFGRVDALVNSIHFSPRDDDDETWQAAFDILFLLNARLTRLVTPHMKEAGGGSIVHLSSIYGKEAGGRPPYNAMKAALISHAKATALNHAADNIRVNTVAPGSIAAPGGTWWKRREEDPEAMAEFVRDNIPMGRFGTAEEVANVITFLCSPCASWVTGATYVVDGGQSRSNI